MLELQKFIKENKDWEKLLQEKPYCLAIKKSNKYIKFNYNMIDSNFSYEIVRESRGIILDNETFEVKCFPFKKFFNYGEYYADKIDWESSRIQNKIDGSIISIFFDDNIWHIATNGTINAFEAMIMTPTDRTKSFGDLFIDGLINSKNEKVIRDITEDKTDFLNPDYTYIFEIVSPLNRIVIRYPESAIFHIGTRNIKTFEELNVDIGIKKPTEYKFNSIEECISASKALDGLEGYVVVDKYYHRVKMKSEQYLNLHHLKNNNVLTDERILDLIRTNESDEFLSVFDEYKDLFDEIKDKYSNLLKEFNIAEEFCNENKNLERKDFALKVKDFAQDKKYLSDFMFQNYLKNIAAINYITNLESFKITRNF